ncbi:leucine-rich repeat domain-containing protein [Treponema denticola]|uniref:leucine-rich repeat domain-containing protein n=1 Tax=Treponema denticola TaxID=158 RepID=UPI003D938915
MKQNLKPAVNLTALVLAAGLLIGLVTGCKPKIDPKYNYKVEHLQQNIADDNYTLYETETLSGKDGETTSAAAKTYAGFTVQSFSQAAIKTDGSTVVQIKYNRNIITLTLNLTGGTTTTPLTDGEGGTKLLKGKFGAKVELENLKKGSDILGVWTPELSSTFPASSPDTTYVASWTNQCRITVKGDERTAIPSPNIITIGLAPAKTWQDIQGDVANKVILKPEWPGSDYEVYEWRLDDENGTKLTDDYQIKSQITVYAVTNYAKFNIIDNKIKLTAEGKGYTRAAPKGKIIIPDGITEIEDATSPGNGAFKDCTEISSIKFPQTLTKIGKNAFARCTGLTSLDLSACTSLTKISENAFYGCTGLVSISMPASLAEIGWGAFYKCTGLTSITLPANLTRIDYNAFSGCTGITSLTIDSANTKYKTEGNILYSKDGTTLIFAAGGLTSANIPDTVTTIGPGAFALCTGLTSITLPANINEIGWGTFYECTGLTSITLPANLTEIGQSAFVLCTGLTSITLPANLTQIDSGAFHGCTGLTSISLPANLTEIGVRAFEGCTGLTSVHLPANLTQIGWGAFSGCTGLTSAVFADKNNWKVYDDEAHTQNETEINSSDLDNPATAAKYLRQTYVYKFWKKN